MQKLKGVHLVIASGSEKVQICLQKMFTKQGAKIVLCGFLNLEFVNKLVNEVSADVILIDMDDSYEDDDEALDRLLENVDLPILFHDNDFDELNNAKDGECFSAPAAEKLAVKLAELVDNDAVNERIKLESDTVSENKIQSLLAEVADIENVSEEKNSVPETIEVTLKEKVLPDIQAVEELLVVETEPQLEDAKRKLNVWVLGASIGGPEAVKRFLARIPKELPVAFVLAQHLGDGFVSLLANQLDRVSHFDVKEGIAGDTLKHGEVVVVPVDNRMSINDKGQIKFIEEDWKGHYKPSIDCVIDDVTESFKKQSGVIIFSGMGADGVLASQQFAENYNGIIWAQSSDTCVISSMPDSVREANLVSYSGSPEALALKIAVQYMGKNSYII